MTPSADEPTRDQLLAMAYADGELHAAAAADFEARLEREPALGLEVSKLRGLELLVRKVAPPEPIEIEWQRLRKDPLQRTGHQLGNILALVGVIGLTLAVCLTTLQSPMGPVSKCSLCALWIGLALLFAAVLRARLRTLPFDPYTKVQR